MRNDDLGQCYEELKSEDRQVREHRKGADDRFEERTLEEH